MVFPKKSGFDFIVRLVKHKAFHNDFVVAEFIDKEGTVTDMKVEQGFRVVLRPGSTYVIHRAKIVDGKGVVDAWAMFAYAPRCYVWRDA